jgi:5-formyltetrahydrofolate cyclo-ligase
MAIEADCTGVDNRAIVDVWMHDKAQLRRTLKAMRDDLDDRLMRSVQLWVELAALPVYRRAHTVMAFSSVGSEPDTDSLFARLEADGKQLLLPRVDGARIVAVPTCRKEPMVRSPFGVAEPQGPPVDSSTIDLVVVPGLGFTPGGRRLGYGGGFYDRFLADFTGPSVGVCFVEQLLDELPAEAHDVLVHAVLTG